jgi:hypothetical protein
MKRSSVWALALVPLATLAEAQTQPERPALDAVRVSTRPVIDGRLDDPAWRGAPQITSFSQMEPVDGAPATEQTEAWIAYDSQYLYFAFYAHYSDPLLIRATAATAIRSTVTIAFPFIWIPSSISSGPSCSPSTDTACRQTACAMRAPVGRASALEATAVRKGDEGPAAGPQVPVPLRRISRGTPCSASGSLVEDGWVAEIAIPFKSLRYPIVSDGGSHRWGFQVLRSIISKDEEVVWSPVSRDVQGFLTQMGDLGGIRDLSTARNLEIQPELTAVQFGSLDAGTGRYRDSRVDPSAGFNLKYGVTSNVVVDFTLNPDFSQIETDRPQIEVNQRFPLFYEEKRPFFLEGKEIFNTTIPLLHTRTIVDPRFGGKLTGKIGRTTFGMLVANDEAPGLVDDVTSPAFEQSAQFAIGRVRYELPRESHLGAIVTTREFLQSSNRIVGVDGRFALGRVHRLTLMAASSWDESLTGVRRTGTAFDVNFTRVGRGLAYTVSHANYTPDFRSSTGFIRRVDQQNTVARTSYTFWPQNRFIVSWGQFATYTLNYNHAGQIDDHWIGTATFVTFARNINVNVQNWGGIERFGGVSFRVDHHAVTADLNFSRRFSLNVSSRWEDQIRYIATPFLGRAWERSAELSFRPASNFETGLTANLNRLVDPRNRTEVFDIGLYRSRTTYQFTPRLLARSILEYDSWEDKLGVNLLLTYRINAGTVLFLGMDDRLQDARHLGEGPLDANPGAEALATTAGLQRTRRVFYLKASYLFRQ